VVPVYNKQLFDFLILFSETIPAKFMELYAKAPIVGSKDL
jgi:hypothetical protein